MTPTSWSDPIAEWDDADATWAGWSPPITARVEVEFTAGVWTDISAYVLFNRAFTMTCGRSDTDERVQPGRLSGLVLRNNDGRFTVGNASGAHWPNVVSGKRLRVSIQDPVSDTYVPRFTGRIDGWPLSWTVNATRCLVTISATDMLGDLVTDPRDTMDRFTRYVFDWSADADELTYWPMVTTRADGGHLPMMGASPLTASAGASPVGASAGPFGIPTTVYGAGPNSWTATPSSANLTSWLAGVMFKMDAPADTSILTVAGGGNTLDVRVTVDGYLRLVSNGGAPKGASTVNICDGQWWWITVGKRSGGTVLSATATSLLDTSISPGTGPGAFTPTDAEGLTGSPMYRTVTFTAAAGACLGHAWWAGSTSATWMVDSRTAYIQTSWGLAYGLPTHAGDVWAIFSTAMYGATVAVSVDAQPMQLSYRQASGTVLDMWGQLDAVDNGVTYATGAGDVEHLGGSYRTRGMALAATLSAGDVDPGIGVAADRLRIVNIVAATARDKGKELAAIEVSDAASVATYGEHRREITVDGYYNYGDTTDDYRLLEPIASRLLAAAEAPRIPTLPLQPLTMSPEQQSAVLATDVWDQIAVTDLPTAGGWDTKWLGRVEGWSETIGANQWDVTFNASFAGNRLEDATFGLILGNNRLG